MDEQQLAHTWRKERFRELYDANYDDVWLYCLRRMASRQDAEELLAETFSVAWQRVEDVPKGTDARPWLFGVARNKIRNRWRKNHRRSQLTDKLAGQAVLTLVDDPAEVAVSEDLSALTSALALLSEKDQELLRLAAWEELSHREMAVALGCSENAVAIRLHRARGRLAKKLEQSGTRKPNVTPGRPAAKAQPASEQVRGNEDHRTTHIGSERAGA